MITVFHMNRNTWAASLPNRHEDELLVAFHSRLETIMGMDKVAEVDTADLDVAYELTNHINKDWTLNKGVKSFNGTAHRSTDIGDVLFDGAKAWVVAGCDFVELGRAA